MEQGKNSDSEDDNKDVFAQIVKYAGDGENSDSNDSDDVSLPDIEKILQKYTQQSDSHDSD